MALTGKGEVVRKFDVPCSCDRVFDVLADVPYSVSHFPDVDQLVDIGANTYRWEMKKLGTSKYYFQPVYACKYESDKEGLWVKWTPVKEVGNSVNSGCWNIRKIDDEHTEVHLQNSVQMTSPLPSILRPVVEPIVKREITRLVDQYIKNLKITFSS